MVIIADDGWFMNDTWQMMMDTLLNNAETSRPNKEESAKENLEIYVSSLSAR